MHIYREISSAQVKRRDSLNNHNSHKSNPMNGPVVPTRTSSLNLNATQLQEKNRKVPAELIERYLKTAYNPTAEPWFSSTGTKDGELFTSGGSGSTLRRSLRKMTDRSRALSPSKNNTNSMTSNVNITDNSASVDREGRSSSNSPPMYKIRARSNSFKENNNGWINVGPEFSIKPTTTNGIQPIINVTIIQSAPPQQPKIPEPDYNNGNHVAERISGNGNLTVQSLGSSTPRPAPPQVLPLQQQQQLHILKPRNTGAGHALFREPYQQVQGSTPHSSSFERDGLYRASFNLSTLSSNNYGGGNGAPNTSLPPSPGHHGKSKFASLLSRRSSSASRPPISTSQPLLLPNRGGPELKPVLKKRSSSSNGLDRKKTVTFSDYTTVFP